MELCFCLIIINSLIIMNSLIILHNKSQLIDFIANKIRREKGDAQMKELVKRLIGKRVQITTLKSSFLTGFIKEVADNSIVVETKREEIIINLDYVVTIREMLTKKEIKQLIAEKNIN